MIRSRADCLRMASSKPEFPTEPLCLVFGDEAFLVRDRAGQVYDGWCADVGGEDHEIIDGVVRNAAEALPPAYTIWLHVVTDGPWEAHDDHAVRLMVGSTAAQEHGTTLPQSAPRARRMRRRSPWENSSSRFQCACTRD